MVLTPKHMSIWDHVIWSSAYDDERVPTWLPVWCLRIIVWWRNRNHTMR
jgi:hypothetical protein